MQKLFTICLLFVYCFSHDEHDYSIYDGLRGAAMSLVEDCLYESTNTVVVTSKVSDKQHYQVANYIIQFLIENIKTCVQLFIGASANKPWNFNVVVVDDVKALS